MIFCLPHSFLFTFLLIFIDFHCSIKYFAVVANVAADLIISLNLKCKYFLREYVVAIAIMRVIKIIIMIAIKIEFLHSIDEKNSNLLEVITIVFVIIMIRIINFAVSFINVKQKQLADNKMGFDSLFLSISNLWQLIKLY